MTDTPTPFQRLCAIISRFVLTVDSRCGAATLPREQGQRIVSWLMRTKDRIRRLQDRLDAGRGNGLRGPRPPKPTDPRTSETTDRPPAPPRPKRERQFPARRGWLLPLLPEAASNGNYIALLLEDPQTRDWVEQAPQLRRHLRSLCHALAVSKPDWMALPTRPRIPKRPRPWRPRERRPPTDMRKAVQIAWPGLRRPPHLHGPQRDRTALEAWLDRHDPIRKRNARDAIARAKREAKIAAWDAQYGPQAQATAPNPPVPRPKLE